MNFSGSLSLYMANPFRYRGYYYDLETGFYYLNSRYYDPAVGRFINADNAISGVGGDIRGYNLFAYCMNNPVNMSDPSGHWPKWIKNAASAVVNTVKKVVTAVVNTVKSVVASVTSVVNSSAKSNVVKTATPNRRPNTGNPGDTYEAPNGDKRTYGPDGRPKHDYDHDDHGQPSKHPHDENGGHNHDWDWDKSPPRGAPYASDRKPVAGVALITVCVIGIVVVAADDVTGIGVADDFLFGPLGAGVGQGLIMVFG